MVRRADEQGLPIRAKAGTVSVVKDDHGMAWVVCAFVADCETYRRLGWPAGYAIH